MTSSPGAPGAPRRRGLRPTRVVGLAMVVLIILEVLAIRLVDSLVGPWWTILVLLGSSLLGAWLIKREGGRAWRALGQALREGRMPATELADGIVVLVGGLLLVVPGFVTDIVGLVLILPFTRPVARGLLAGAIANRVLARAEFATGPGVTGTPAGPTSSAPNTSTGGPASGPAGPQRSASSDEVIEGEVVEDD
ncbi:MAG: FxsA family protein [Terracoccus sp.]